MYPHTVNTYRIHNLYYTFCSFILGLYFSALWCPPCRMFTPKLKTFYHRGTEKGRQFEVVFVSSDSDQEAFDEYFQEMPWAALSYESREIRVRVGVITYISSLPTNTRSQTKVKKCDTVADLTYQWWKCNYICRYQTMVISKWYIFMCLQC